MPMARTEAITRHGPVVVDRHDGFGDLIRPGGAAALDAAAVLPNLLLYFAARGVDRRVHIRGVAFAPDGQVVGQDRYLGDVVIPFDPQRYDNVLNVPEPLGNLVYLFLDVGLHRVGNVDALPGYLQPHVGNLRLVPIFPTALR